MRQIRSVALTLLLTVTRLARADDPQSPPASPPDGTGWHYLPDERIFVPLMADPRWPEFSASYAYVSGASNPRITNSGRISLGESITLVEYDAGPAGRFGTGVEPGVYALFDLNGPANRLVNADYRIGIPLDYRRGPLSAEAAVFHQSSHLGDAFVVEPSQTDLNLSYEALTATGSFDGPVRLYAGAGVMVHSVPANLKPWWLLQGIEWRRRFPSFSDWIVPVAAAHLEEHQETSWDVDLSVRAGLEFSQDDRSRRRFQVLLEYYQGHNPNGQFFPDRIRTIGVGIHLFF